MQNFTYYIPTKIHFGKDKVFEIVNEIPAKSKIMLTYGSGSIKKNGIYEQVKQILNTYEVVEFGGIMENPTSEYLQKAIEFARNEQVDYMLAIGGGSVIDATKFISAGYFYDGDAWDFVTKKIPITKTIPFGTVLTLPATSSEMNFISVISNTATQEKYSFRDDALFPKFSVIDPEYTFSLSKKQLGYAICDSFLHVMEQYMNTANTALLQNYMSESLLTILLEEGTKAMQFETPDYNNRANLAWAQSWCLNGMIQAGVPTDLATHKVGHELTALYNITHAPSLGVTYPSVLRMIKTLRKPKMLRFAKAIMHVNASTEDETMNVAIEKTIQFFNAMGISHRLCDYNIPLNAYNVVCDRFIQRGLNVIGNMQDINVNALRPQLINDQKAFYI